MLVRQFMYYPSQAYHERILFQHYQTTALLLPWFLHQVPPPVVIYYFTYQDSTQLHYHQASSVWPLYFHTPTLETHSIFFLSLPGFSRILPDISLVTNISQRTFLAMSKVPETRPLGRSKKGPAFFSTERGPGKPSNVYLSIDWWLLTHRAWIAGSLL